MKKSRRSRKHSKTNNGCNENDEKEVSLSPHTTPISRENFIVAATVAGIAYLAIPLILDGFGKPSGPPLPSFNASEFVKSSASSVEERLMEEWQPGDLVTIREIEEGNRGLFATRDIPKGQVIARVQYPDLERDILRDHPSLKAIVNEAMESAIKRSRTAPKWITLTTGKVLSLIQLLLEDSMGEQSIWQSFMETLPRNVSNMAWYWSEEEKKCVVPRPNSMSLHHDLEVYHQVLQEVKTSFPPLAEIYNQQRAEWAYLMLKTRGFGQYFLPVLHLANHNPLEAVPAFLIPAADTAVYVATHNIRGGEAVYTSYGPMMTPVVTAEQYGFVESEDTSVFFEVPSILEDFLHGEKTRNERLCNADPVRFFGNVTTQIVGTTFKGTGHSTYFKAYLPDERSYACIRVLLQTERDTDVARYISEKMEADFNRYSAMANDPNCQSSDGNFPLIRRSNEVMAKLLWGALEVAEKGRDWKIPYPGIPTYIMNYPDEQQ